MTRANSETCPCRCHRNGWEDPSGHCYLCRGWPNCKAVKARIHAKEETSKASEGHREVNKEIDIQFKEAERKLEEWRSNALKPSYDKLEAERREIQKCYGLAARACGCDECWRWGEAVI